LPLLTITIICPGRSSCGSGCRSSIFIVIEGGAMTLPATSTLRKTCRQRAFWYLISIHLHLLLFNNGALPQDSRIRVCTPKLRVGTGAHCASATRRESSHILTMAHLQHGFPKRHHWRAASRWRC
jgi:hypothetical protein